jgi:bifunctional non-homologous end joining protein LigD
LRKSGVLSIERGSEAPHIDPKEKGMNAKKGKGAAVRFVEPMKARLVEHAPPGEWIYEIKLDGFRALALKRGDNVQLWSRNQKELTFQFPELAQGLKKIKADDAIIDGEIVALEPSGKSSFQLLQAYNMGEEQPPLFFFAFDLLQLNGRDLTRETVVARKAALEKLLKKPPSGVRFSESLTGDADQLLEQARRLGLEGLIGKRADSRYEAGLRSGAWIKLKLGHEQEMVIGGYTKPQGSRKYFGSLVCGYYVDGKLIYAGRVGTGFNEKTLKAVCLKLRKIEVTECPFANLPERRSGSKWSPSLTAAEMRWCHWVEPRLVCQVRFAEWTRDGKLRQPVFLGLREDKRAQDVVRETPVES